MPDLKDQQDTKDQYEINITNAVETLNLSIHFQYNDIVACN